MNETKAQTIDVRTSKLTGDNLKIFSIELIALIYTEYV